MIGPWVPEWIAAASKEKTEMALIAMTKKTRCRVPVMAAILAVVSLGIAPGTAYAQHRGGGGGGWHGGGGHWGGGHRGGGWGGAGIGLGVLGGALAGAAIANSYYGYPYSYGYGYPYYGGGYAPYYGYGYGY